MLTLLWSWSFTHDTVKKSEPFVISSSPSYELEKSQWSIHTWWQPWKATPSMRPRVRLILRMMMLCFPLAISATPLRALPPPAPMMVLSELMESSSWRSFMPPPVMSLSMMMT